MTAHVAVLRGVNVGGKNRLPMAELRMFEAAGATRVKTRIQSGNVFEAKEADAAGIAVTVGEALVGALGFQA